MTQVIIIGGHGKIALRLAKILSDRGDKVTSVIRNDAQSDDVSATGAEPLLADVEKLDTAGLASVLAGQDRRVVGRCWWWKSRTHLRRRPGCGHPVDGCGESGRHRPIHHGFVLRRRTRSRCAGR